MKMPVKIKFEDGSEEEIPDVWIECAKLKYGLDWDEYYKMVYPKIEELWKQGKILTKFGVEDIKEEMTRAEHAATCIYADLRACIMSKLLEEVAERLGIKPPKVVAISKDDVTVYEGDKVEKYDSIDEVI